MAAHALGSRQRALDSPPACRRSDPRELGRRPPACVRALRRRRNRNTRARRANGAARHRRPLPVRPQSDVPRRRRRGRRPGPPPWTDRLSSCMRACCGSSSSPSCAGTRSPRSTVSSARSTTPIGEQCRAGCQDALGIADEPALPVHSLTKQGQGSAAAPRGSIQTSGRKAAKKDEPPGCGPRGFVSLAASHLCGDGPEASDSAAQPTPPNHRRHIWRASRTARLGGFTARWTDYRGGSGLSQVPRSSDFAICVG